VGQPQRVLRGAQDGFDNLEHGGLTNDVAYAVHPDGRVFVMANKADQQAFYKAYIRKTAIESYNPKK
jgi:hypothetical protein